MRKPPLAIRDTSSCCPLGVGLALWLSLAGPAWAAGSPANTAISNTATVSFTDSNGQPQTVLSNTVALRVDEILGVTVVNNDAGNVSVSTPDDDDPLSFTITNPGNGSEAYGLTANPNLGGDQYDPTDTRIWLDDGDGIFEPAQDTLYAPGVNDPVLAPDGSRLVFVSNDTPAGLSTGDTAVVSLTATAVTGSGAPGTTFPGQGTGGVDAVVGATTASATAQGGYVVSATTATLVKTQAVLDPSGGSRRIPGAIVTYTLTLDVAGTAAITSAAVDDAIPANTTYVASSLELDGSPLSDAADADAGSFTGSGIQVSLGTVTPPSTNIVVFQVQID